MQEEEQFETIIQTTDYQLSCLIIQKQNSMRLRLYLNYLQSQQLELQANFIGRESLGGLKYLCKNFNDVKEYLKNQDNYQIDKNNMVIVVYGKLGNNDKNFMLTCIRFNFIQNLDQINLSSKQIDSKLCQRRLQLSKYQKSQARKRKQAAKKRQSQQIKSIKRQFEQFKNQISKQQKQILELINKPQNKQDLQTEKQILSEQLIKKTGIQDFKRRIQQIIQRMQDKNIKLAQDSYMRYQKIQDCMKGLHTQQIILQIARPQLWINNQCYAYKTKLMTIHDNSSIIANNTIFFFGKQNIAKQHKFYIKINKKSSYIRIGITDEAHINEINQANLKTKFYYGSDSKVNCPNNNYESKGLGFKEGQIVEVQINLNIHRISWKVKNQVRQSIRQLVINGDTKWVPFVFMASKNDSITILKRV